MKCAVELYRCHESLPVSIGTNGGLVCVVGPDRFKGRRRSLSTKQDVCRLKMDNSMLAHSSLSPADLVMADDKKQLVGVPGVKPTKALNRVPSTSRGP